MPCLAAVAWLDVHPPPPPSPSRLARRCVPNGEVCARIRQDPIGNCCSATAACTGDAVQGELTCEEQPGTCIAVNQVCESSPFAVPCCAGTVCARFGFGVRVCLPLTPALRP